jgi:esterase/lipase superfamily enzyme
MHYFITNREIITKNGIETIREDGQEHAGDDLRFGTYNIETRKFNLFKDPNKTTDTNYSRLRSAKVSTLKGSARLFRSLYDEFRDDQAIPGKNDVLFFIHGFNTDLPGVRENYRDLHKRYVANPLSPIGRIVIFTWPGKSKDLPLHYRDDRKDAERSGQTLARCMTKLLDFFKEFLERDRNPLCRGKIHLLVHSMGHRVLKHMMIELKEKGIGSPEIFDQIVLMAADIEFDIFENGLPFNRLIEFGKRIHIYFHERDVVLDISKLTKNFNNRLGRYGRKKNDTSSPDIIDVNVTATKDDKGSGIQANALNHWYYTTSTEVVNDVVKVLNGDVFTGTRSL